MRWSIIGVGQLGGGGELNKLFGQTAVHVRGVWCLVVPDRYPGPP